METCQNYVIVSSINASFLNEPALFLPHGTCKQFLVIVSSIIASLLVGTCTLSDTIAAELQGVVGWMCVVTNQMSVGELGFQSFPFKRKADFMVDGACGAAYPLLKRA